MPRLLVIVFITLLGCAAPLLAQTGSPPASPDDPPPLRVGPVTVSGYVQADSLFVAGDDLDESSDTFRLRRARIGVGGDFAPKVGWSLSVELSGSPHVRDAYMTVRFVPQFQVRVGQFYPLYGLERMTSSSRLEVVDRTRLTDAVTYERNPGVMILNGEPYRGWIGYSVGMFNGTGMNRTDDNDAKDVVGRIVVTPPALEGLTIGVSGGTGQQRDGDRERTGAYVEFARDEGRVVLEALRETHSGLRRDGFYVLGAYRFVPAAPTPHFRMIEIAARFLQFDDPAAARDPAPGASFVLPRTRELQFGGNYHVNRALKFLLNAIVPVDDRDRPDATLIGRFQVLF